VVVRSSVLHHAVSELEIISLSEDEIQSVLLGSTLHGQIRLGQDAHGPYTIWVYILGKLQNLLRRNVNVAGNYG